MQLRPANYHLNFKWRMPPKQSRCTTFICKTFQTGYTTMLNPASRTLCLVAIFWFCAQFAQAQMITSACNIDVDIPENNNSCATYLEYNLSVNGVVGMLGTDVFVSEVDILIEHEWVNDLTVSLRSPNGVEVVLTERNGGTGNNYGDPQSACTLPTCFVVDACTKIDTAQAPFIGQFIPEGNLYDFNDGSTANGNWTLRICDQVNDNQGILKYVAINFAPVGCLQPINPNIVSIDSTTLNLDWSSGAACTGAIIEYGPVGFVPGTGTTVAATCPPYSLQGLAPNTSYDIYINDVCMGVNSPRSCVIQGTTLCAYPAERII